jgi:apolipoprotein N-acyltransferase
VEKSGVQECGMWYDLSHMTKTIFTLSFKRALLFEGFILTLALLGLVLSYGTDSLVGILFFLPLLTIGFGWLFASSSDIVDVFGVAVPLILASSFATSFVFFFALELLRIGMQKLRSEN